MPPLDPIPKSASRLFEKVVAKVPIIRDPVFGYCLLGTVVISAVGSVVGFTGGEEFKRVTLYSVVALIFTGLLYYVLKERGVLRTGEQRQAERNVADIFPPLQSAGESPRKQRRRAIDPAAPIVLDDALRAFCAEHLILAIASGKGGVGKTMLAVACAHELSLGGPTILLDLDFFNRGLAGLFEKTTHLAILPRPEFLGPAALDEHREWRLQRIASDLYHFAYDNLGPAEFKALKALTVGAITHGLGEFLQRAVALIQKTTDSPGPVRIVLDCHGGPDDISFAAAVLARHTLLISEPDRITFRGTEHFLAQLAGLKSEPAPRVHLVFNKIGPAFTTPVLLDLYDKYLRAHFGERELLALFPLEPALSKAFETEPLITHAYPYSLLARKMRFLLVKLLRTDGERYLASSALTLPRFAQNYRYRTLGRVPWWLDPHRVFPVILTVLALLVFCEVYGRRFLFSQLTALSRAELNVVATEHPEIKLDPETQDALFLAGKQVGPMTGKSVGEVGWEYGIANRLLAIAVFQSDVRLVGERIHDPNKEALGVERQAFACRRHIDYFLSHAAGSIKAPAYPQTWDMDLKTLRGGKWWDWLTCGAAEWWRENYFNGVMFSLLWLSVGLYLDCTRRIDAQFTRAVRGREGSGVLWLVLGAGLWAAPVLFAITAFSKTETDADILAMQVAVVLIELPYLVVAIHQMYRCWRIGGEGMRDVRGERNQRTWRESGTAGRIRILLGAPMELWWRFTFILVILGSAATLIVLAATPKRILPPIIGLMPEQAKPGPDPHRSVAGEDSRERGSRRGEGPGRG